MHALLKMWILYTYIFIQATERLQSIYEETSAQRHLRKQ